MTQLGKLLKNFQVDQTDPQAASVVKAFLEAGADANITFSITSAEGTLSISGKIWQAFAKIAVGFGQSGSPSLRIRDFQ